MMLTYLKYNLKAAIEFRADFFIQNGSMIITNFLFMGAILYLATQVESVYTTQDLIMGFTIANIAFVLGINFFRGVEMFGRLVVNGRLDILMMRPISVYTHTIFHKTNPYSAGEILTAIIFLLLNPIHTWPFILGVSIISGVLIHYVAFLLNLLPLFIDVNRQPNLFEPIITFMFYPPDIYTGILKFFALFVFPGTMIAFGPIISLYDPIFWITYIGFTFFIVILFFTLLNIGLKKYRSAGY